MSAIGVVATIGGLMFDYDSGVNNGTQEGLRSTFNLSEAFKINILSGTCRLPLVWRPWAANRSFLRYFCQK